MERQFNPPRRKRPLRPAGGPPDDVRITWLVRRRAIASVLLAVLAALAFGGFALSRAHSEAGAREFREHGGRTTGTVEVVRGARGGVRYVVADYTVDSIRYRQRVYTDVANRSYDTGDVVDVLYDPRKPLQMTIVGETGVGRQGRIAPALVFLGMVLLGLAILATRGARAAVVAGRSADWRLVSFAAVPRRGRRGPILALTPVDAPDATPGIMGAEGLPSMKPQPVWARGSTDYMLIAAGGYHSVITARGPRNNRERAKWERQLNEASTGSR